MARVTTRLPDSPPVPPINSTIRLLVVLLALSLTLHAATIYTLYQVRNTARIQVGALADELAAAEDEVLTLNVPVRLPVPVEADVPIRKTIRVPIETTIALDTTFNVPLNTPFGTYEVPVPIRGSVPVKLEAPVTIDETVTVSTTIAIDSTLPIELPVADTPLQGYLSRLREALLELGEQL
ncbi:MAG: hypothetical protein DIU80_019005 [Chloroflexota bacterium]